MTGEQAEENAQWLMETAARLGKLRSSVADWVVGDYCRTLRDSAETVDLLTGPEIDDVMSAMRQAAMLLDRSAAIKFYGE